MITNRTGEAVIFANHREVVWDQSENPVAFSLSVSHIMRTV